jgi:hypothetical protein
MRAKLKTDVVQKLQKTDEEKKQKNMAKTGKKIQIGQ